MIAEAPAAHDAERSLLAAVIMAPACIPRARAAITPDAFHRAAHAAIFRAVLSLADRGEGIDIVSVADELKGQGQVVEHGWHSFISPILDAYTTAANVETHARAIRLAWVKRRAMRAASDLSETVANGAHGTTISEVIGGYGSRLAEIAAEAEPGAKPPTLEDQTCGDTLFADGEQAPDDLIGSGYLVAGGFSLVAAPPGFGKTYLALQVMRSLATGLPWLDYEAPRRAASLMVQLEMPRYAIRERVARDREAFADLAHWLIMPEGFGALETGSTLDQLCSLVDKRQIRYVCLDPLHQCHTGNLNFDDEISPFLAAVKKLCQRTGAHVQVLHHLNKIEFDKHDSIRSNAIRNIKGSGRLTGDPSTVIVLLERMGRLLLVNAKTRLGPSIESIAIRQGDDGWFQRVDTPEEIAQGSDNKIAACLRAHGRNGVSIEQVCEECVMSRRTAERHLQDAGAVRLGGGRGRGREARWYAPQYVPQESADLPGDNSQTICDDDSHPF